MNRRTLLLLVGIALAVWGIVQLASSPQPGHSLPSGLPGSPGPADPEFQGREQPVAEPSVAPAPG